VSSFETAPAEEQAPADLPTPPLVHQPPPPRLRATLLRFAVAIAILAVLPLLLTSHRNDALLTAAVVYGVIGSGLGLVYGQVGLLSMSHAALWGIGSYAGAIAVSNHGLSFWPAFLVATLVGTIAGAVSALPAFRLRGHYLLITGFIITELMVVVENQWTSLTGGPSGMFVLKQPGPIFGVRLDTQRGFYYVCVVVLVLAVALVEVVRASRLGRRFAATRENALLARTVGINTRNAVILGFMLSGVFAGAGGMLYAVQLNHIEPSLFGLPAAVLLPLIVLIGGAQRAWGPAVGGFIVVFLPEVLGLSPQTAEAVNGALLIVMILLMPDGVLAGLGALAQRTWAAVSIRTRAT
jgi:branched-chain amino acid transport system permease protein